jgi:Ca2+-binding RTX toxin-like protein
MRVPALGGVIVLLSLLVVPGSSAQASTPTCFGLAATIVGTAGADNLVGTTGDDVIVGLEGNDTIDGAGGIDHVCGSRGDDVIGETEPLHIKTRLIANGGLGDDRLSGTSERDSLIGGDGTDLLSPSNGADSMIGGGGEDTIDARFDFGTINLSTGRFCPQSGACTSLHGIEDALGPLYQASTITGDDGANVLVAGTGGDAIFGLGGDDHLDGGDGTDTLDGGDGTDTCLNGETVLNCEAAGPPQ